MLQYQTQTVEYSANQKQRRSLNKFITDYKDKMKIKARME